MNKDERKLRGEIFQIQKRVTEEFKNQNCLFPQCPEQAILSHSISKKFLKKVFPTGKFYSFGHDPFGGKFKFSEKGINEVSPIAQYCFCNSHDRDLFKEIENDNKIDFNNYRHLMLLCFRASVMQLRKEEFLLRFFTAVSSELGFQEDPFFEEKMRQTKSIIELNKLYLQSFLKDYNAKTQSFFLNAWLVPSLGICCSTIFSNESDSHLDQVNFIERV